MCLASLPILAQSQIGGGVCSSASLSGMYSLTLTGRNVSSGVTFSMALQGNGTATFDGLSLVTFTLTNNSNTSFGVSQTLSGTYSMQANCVGVLNITTGDTASFTLESYNQGKGFLITGQDGVYSFTGSGTALPASCSASTLSGVYSFNGTGFALASGVISGINNISGIIQFDGTSAVTSTWYVATNGSITSSATTGQYTVAAGCTASATVADTSGNTYNLQFTITAANGSNFLVTGSNARLIFTGSGRTTPNTVPACTAATLTGTRSLVLAGRNVNSSVQLTGTTQGAGSATFDGVGAVTFNLTTNTSQAQGVTQTLSGTYTLGTNCVGTLSIVTGDTANFTLIAYNAGKNLTLTGGDGTYALTGSGDAQPVACAASTLSGGYAMSGTGFALDVGFLAGVNTISGVLQFDGRGDVTGSWSVAGSGSGTSAGVSGHYSVTAACLASATVTDASGSSYALTFAITSADASNFSADIATTAALFSATGHSEFTNPGSAVVNAASFVAAGTPPGSIFAIVGSGLATAAAQPNNVPLPTTELTTTVTVNGEAAPLFYVSPTQINAQMPLDIQPGIATVVVTNGSSVSNAAAVTVPATAVPGIFLYNSNRAVVQNPGNSVNSPTAPARVGDTVVGYLTGGGPVQAAGAWVTGSASPNGLSPVTENYSVTVGGQPAVVNYIGLAPTLVGAYQVNFVIPKVAAGDRGLVLTIDGTASNTALISVAN
jgi:uncharacterized protein (TIGR03437 family)